MMKNISKIIFKKTNIIILLFILLFSSITNAFAYFVDKATITTDHLISTMYLRHNGTAFRAYFVTYTGPDGVKHPAYCLNDGVDGPETGDYTITVTGYTNDKIWRAMRYGYPYSTPAQMGLSNADQAFYVTKQAIYCVLGQRNINNFTANGSANNSVLTALQNLVNKALTGTETYQSPLYTYTSTNTIIDNIDSNYFSKTYTVSANANATSITISIAGTTPTGTKITDMNNVDKTTFNVGEQFKVLIPKNAVTNLHVSFSLNVKGTVETYPVLYASSGTSALQDNALAVEPFEINTSVLPFDSTLGADVTIMKTDKDTGATLSGAKFKIYEDLNNNGQVDSTDTLIGETNATGANGQTTFSNLVAGNYLAVESVGPTGYNLNTVPIPFTITVNGNNVTVSAKDTAITGNVTITKVDRNTNKTLSGAKFKIYKDLNNNGKIDSTDTLIGETNATNTNGQVTYSNLQYGNYIAIESIAPNGYNLAPEVLPFSITTQGQTATITVKDTVITGDVEITKVDRDNTSKVLSGATFNIYQDVNNNGELDSTDILIGETDVTNDKGQVDFTNLKYGNYIAVEKTAPEGYNLDTDIIPFSITTQDEVVTITAKDKVITSTIVISKQAENDNTLTGDKEGTYLPNATFEILDKIGNVVKTVTTGEDGKVEVTLPYGTYTIKEINSPEYYLNDNEPQIIQVTKQNQTIPLSFTDKSVDINVHVEKTGFIKTQSNDTIYYDFKNIQNLSNVALDNFTWSDTLPTDALRADRVYTGTWNQDLQYSIWYKTNINDYEMLVDNLNTKTNYEIKFDDAKLQEDEYITEYEFRFGTVDIGFHEEETPILYCKMLDELKNGYICTNNTKVSGTYFDKYVEDKDSWNTIIYHKELPIDKLPKTRNVGCYCRIKNFLKTISFCN